MTRQEEVFFTCPITLELFEDPVVASDGFTYSKTAIQTWLTQSNLSPMTLLPLENKHLISNKTMKSLMSIKYTSSPCSSLSTSTLLPSYKRQVQNKLNTHKKCVFEVTHLHTKEQAVICADTPIEEDIIKSITCSTISPYETYESYDKMVLLDAETFTNYVPGLGSRKLIVLYLPHEQCTVAYGYKGVPQIYCALESSSNPDCLLESKKGIYNCYHCTFLFNDKVQRVCLFEHDSNNHDRIQIDLRSGHKKLFLIVDLTKDKVYDIKLQIMANENIWTQNQELYFNGCYLVEDKLLMDYGIHKNSVLQHVYRPTFA